MTLKESLSSPALQNGVSGPDSVMLMLMGHFQLTELGLNI